MNKILFIITGSIAAKRCIEIFALLDPKRIQISCLLTKEATKYVRKKSISKYAKKRIFTDTSEKNNKMLHINLSRSNDIIVVCPATAHSIAKFANGYGDNLASNTLLAANKKILFVPAMNSYMWNNKINKKNIKIIKKLGIEFIGPKVGNLKCGEFGIGRIADSKTIVKKILQNLESIQFFKDKKILITAGPTIEMIDPIRYISNHSSGKQGYELAYQLALSGAQVILVSGPSSLDPPPNVKFIKIFSANDMQKVITKFSNLDIGIFSAAVSDFKVKNVKKLKEKKKKITNLKLIKNVDILEKIGNSKNNRPKLLIGFAAETGGIDLAKRKLRKKNCDMIVYNKIDSQNKIFGSDYNRISIITKNYTKNFNKMTKINCSKIIIDCIHKLS